MTLIHYIAMHAVYWEIFEIQNFQGLVPLSFLSFLQINFRGWPSRQKELICMHLNF